MNCAMDMLLCDIFSGDADCFIASRVQDKSNFFDLFQCTGQEPSVGLPDEHSLLFPIQHDPTDFCRYKLPSLEQEPDTNQSEDASRRMVSENVDKVMQCQQAARNNANSAGMVGKSYEVHRDSSVAPYCAELDVGSKGIETSSEEESVCAVQAPKKRRVEKASAIDGWKVEADAGQRMAHIAVERNRRKQMNEQLAILRSLMPASYVQRGDQASVIGGVVEFVKELQQLVVSLEEQRQRRSYSNREAVRMRASGGGDGEGDGAVARDAVVASRSAVAQVEVRLTGGGATVLLRTLSPKAAAPPGHLRQLATALESLCLQILHVNIHTVRHTVLYAFTLQIGLNCQLSLEDLADAVQRIFKEIRVHV